MSAFPWWSVHPPVETIVECSGENHEIRWSEGTLQIPRHADPTGERVLALLGVEHCRCVDVFDAWEGQKEDLRVLILASRGPGDSVRNVSANPQGMQAGWYGQAPPHLVNRLLPGRAAQFRTARLVPAPQATPSAYSRAVAMSLRGPRRLGATPEQDELESLFALGGGIPDRLVATVLAAWSERVESQGAGSHQAQLVAALFGRVTLALRNWLGDPNLEVDVEMIGAREPASLSRNGDILVARLPFRWLLDVWAGGLTVVLGRFSLNLVNESDGRQRVMTTGPDLADIRPVTISLGTSQ